MLAVLGSLLACAKEEAHGGPCRVLIEDKDDRVRYPCLGGTTAIKLRSEPVGNNKRSTYSCLPELELHPALRPD